MKNHRKTENQTSQTKSIAHCLTRRGFFQVGAAASASVLIGPDAKAEARASDKKIRFDSYDVAVIGSGPGGLSAATVFLFIFAQSMSLILGAGLPSKFPTPPPPA